MGWEEDGTTTTVTTVVTMEDIMEDTDTTDITMADNHNVINVEICAYFFHSFLIPTNTTRKEYCLC